MCEERIDKLRVEFGQEKANKAELEKELNKLQEEKNQQLASLNKERRSVNQPNVGATADHSTEVRGGTQSNSCNSK